MFIDPEEVTDNTTHQRLLRQFDYEHLPRSLQELSRPFAELAVEMVRHPSLHAADVTVALRKLLEAKDACVRAAVV